MNILFLIFHGLSAVSGISKKIQNQVAGLKACKHRVTLCHYEIQANNHRVRMMDDTLLEDYGDNKLAPLRKRMCYASVFHYATQHQIQFVYVRSFHNANPFTIHLFRQLKKAGIKIVMEIPTYPYDQEYHLLPFRWKLELLIDKCFRRSLAKNCDYIATFSDKEEIFGQKTIQISNGVNFENLPLKAERTKSSTELHFIAVAEIHYWHGYDRMIEGLGKYYRNTPSRQLFLHIVGGVGTAEEQIFQALIQKYELEKYILFYGQKQGRELDELFNQSDFAIGSLGRHRSGIYKIKTLKNREYAARGIPFIYSETDEDFEQMPYILKAPADDSPINIQKIIQFYDTLKISPAQIRSTIQDLSWEKQMKKIIQQIS